VSRDRNKTKKKIIADPNIYRARYGETPIHVASRVLLQLKKLSDIGARRAIFELSKNTLLPRYLKPLYTAETFYRIPSSSEYCSAEHYLYWILGLFHNCAGQLRTFNTVRIDFNGALLRSDDAGAHAALDAVEGVTHCWWAIENRIHVMKELTKASTKDAIQKLRERFEKHSVSGRFRDLLLISESGSITVFATILDAQLKEYRSSGLKPVISYGAVLSCMQLPIAFDMDRTVTPEEANVYKIESLVDQFVLYKTILSEMYVRDEPLDPLLRELSLDLAEKLDDDELRSLVNREVALSATMLTTVNQYTHGQYAAVLPRVQEALVREPRMAFGLLELYARAKLYEGDRSEAHLYDSIALALGDIFMLRQNSDERIAYLKRLCVKFRSESWAKSLMFHVANVLSEMEGTAVVTASRKATLALGEWNTPKASPDYQPDDLFLGSNRDLIPAERMLRHSQELADDSLLQESDFPIAADYLKTQSARYLVREQWTHLIDFSIDMYLQHKFAPYYLPMTEMCRVIADLPKSNNVEFISCLIILDIYNRERGGAYEDLKAELFIDLLDFNGIHKPTSLYESVGPTAHDRYFLRNICVPSQLDNITQFSSNDEVIHERVAILDLLISGSPEIADELRQEKDKVLETMFADKLRAKLETGKLFVDVQALETHRKHHYRKLYDQAKLIEGGTVLAPITERIPSDSSDILEISSDAPGSPLAVTSNEKTGLLYKIFTSAASDFALNENYGLDKYLSAEIRHTVFVTQLRACFEKSKIITVEKQGEYLRNTFWCDKYSYLTPDCLEDLDRIFKSFSRNIDQTLKDVNDHFRVTVGGDDTDGCIFDFSSYYSRLVDVSEILDASADFQQFFNALIDYMWTLAADHAVKAQEFINEQLRPRILEQFHQLESDITIAKGMVQMLELMQEIRNCRSAFNNDLELVLNWFRFVGSDGVESFEPLRVVTEASVSSFQSIYGHKGAEIAFSQQKSQMILNYREARSLFIALFTGIENAVKYRTLGSVVHISHRSVGELDQIEIRNDIDHGTFEDPQGFVSAHRGIWNEAHSDLSRKEGGSGMYKIYNLLHNASAGFAYDIEIDDDAFVSTMGLSHAYFGNRG
jgi:hypothetical protein